MLSVTYYFPLQTGLFSCSFFHYKWVVIGEEVGYRLPVFLICRLLHLEILHKTDGEDAAFPGCSEHGYGGGDWMRPYIVLHGVR